MNKDIVKSIETSKFIELNNDSVDLNIYKVKKKINIKNIVIKDGPKIKNIKAIKDIEPPLNFYSILESPTVIEVNVSKEKRKVKPSRICENCQREFFGKKINKFNRHACKNITKEIQDIILRRNLKKFPIYEKVGKNLKGVNIKNAVLYYNKVDVMDFKHLQDVVEFLHANFNSWFIFGYFDEYMNALGNEKLEKGYFSENLEKYFISIVESNNTSKIEWKEKAISLTRKFNFNENLNLILLKNIPKSEKEFTMKEIAGFFKSYRNNEEMFTYVHKNDSKAVRQMVHPSTVENWPSHSGMLMSKFQIGDAPKKIKKIGYNFIRHLKNIECTEISVLLKTSGYFTAWHHDFIDPPSIALLYQLHGKSTIFGSYGLIPFFYSSRRKNDYDTSFNIITSYFQDKKENCKELKRYYTLHPGEALIVPPGCVHEVHVPDEYVKVGKLKKPKHSVLMVMNLKLDKIQNFMNDAGFAHIEHMLNTPEMEEILKKNEIAKKKKMEKKKSKSKSVSPTKAKTKKVTKRKRSEESLVLSPRKNLKRNAKSARNFKFGYSETDDYDLYD